MAALVTEAKPHQLQVVRIRQEEEESWISSEELHTDGSSDDDGGKWGAKHPHYPHLHHQHPHYPLHHLHLLQHPPASLGVLSPLAHEGGPRGAVSSMTTPPPPPTASEPALQDAPHLTETTRRLSELGVEDMPLLKVTPDHLEQQSDDSLEEQEDIMLWRPKRGSLKLPSHINLSAITTNITTATVTANVAADTTRSVGAAQPSPTPHRATAPGSTATTKHSSSAIAKVMSSVPEVPQTATPDVSNKSDVNKKGKKTKKTDDGGT